MFVLFNSSNNKFVGFNEETNTYFNTNWANKAKVYSDKDEAFCDAMENEWVIPSAEAYALKPSATFETLVDEVIGKMTADYKAWNDSRGYDGNTNYEVKVSKGRVYTKLIRVDFNGSRSVLGFIVNNDTKKFKKGDLLKAAGWNAPATNFARGNIFDNMPEVIRWTGIA